MIPCSSHIVDLRQHKPSLRVCSRVPVQGHIVWRLLSDNGRIVLSDTTVLLWGGLGKGAYGIAYIAENTSDQSRFVLKKVRLARQAGCVVCLAVELCESGDLLSQLQYRSRKDDLVYFSETHLREMLVQLASALDYLHRNNIVHRDVKSSNILITVREVLVQLVQLASALDYLHRSNIVHRAVKSSNMLIADAGRLKLADFGLATTLKSEEDFMYKRSITFYTEPTYATAIHTISDRCSVGTLTTCPLELIAKGTLIQLTTSHKE
eukprot:gene10356-8293_t